MFVSVLKIWLNVSQRRNMNEIKYNYLTLMESGLKLTLTTWQIVRSYDDATIRNQKKASRGLKVVDIKKMCNTFERGFKREREKVGNREASK